MNSYNEYLENIKRKLDVMNKASGVDPQANMELKKHLEQSQMPSNEIFDMLGHGAKMWMEKNKNSNDM
jgi:DNA-binding CsgD family transcriptional regulator